MVIFNPLEKYELVDDVRIHNEYTPATEPVSTTLNATSVDDENTELTLINTLAGVPVHELDDITNADESAFTFTNPEPLITMVCTVELNTGITFGVNAVTDTMSKTPAWK